MKLCGIYRNPGYEPDLSGFACAVFSFGYHNEFRTPIEINSRGAEDFDLVLISGGRSRFGGCNGKILQAYRERGVPVIICEFGRLVPSTILTLINGKPWLPPEDCPDDRLEDLGLIEYDRTRGSDILVCGQRVDLDRQLAPAIELIRQNSDRKIIYRPHPNMVRRQLRKDVGFKYNTLSARSKTLDHFSRTDLDRDLDKAWCVVTHSSVVGVQALLRGIPVIASPEIVCAEMVTPLELADSVESLRLRNPEKLQRFLRRFSYTIWFEPELRLGRAFTFLQRYLG